MRAAQNMQYPIQQPGMDNYDRDGYSNRNTYEPIYPQGFGQL